MHGKLDFKIKHVQMTWDTLLSRTHQPPNNLFYRGLTGSLTQIYSAPLKHSSQEIKSFTLNLRSAVKDICHLISACSTLESLTHWGITSVRCIHCSCACTCASISKGRNKRNCSEDSLSCNIHLNHLSCPFSGIIICLIVTIMSRKISGLKIYSVGIFLLFASMNITKYPLVAV